MAANIPSQPGGIFGGGAYADEYQRGRRASCAKDDNFMSQLEQAEARDVARPRRHADQIVFGDDSPPLVGPSLTSAQVCTYHT